MDHPFHDRTVLPRETTAAVATALLCVVAGTLLSGLTDVASAHGPEGPGWSFRGNGALFVPIGFGSAILAAGWVHLILRWRGHVHATALGVGAGLGAATLVVIGALVLILGAPTDVGLAAQGFLTLTELLWVAASTIGAGFLHVPRPRGGRGRFRADALWLVGAALLPPVALGLGSRAAGALGW